MSSTNMSLTFPLYIFEKNLLLLLYHIYLYIPSLASDTSKRILQLFHVRTYEKLRIYVFVIKESKLSAHE